MAVLAGGAVLWFLQRACYPSLVEAVAQLPAQGQIQNQTLYTPFTNTVLLSQNRILGFRLDLPQEDQPRLMSDFQVTFYLHEWRLCHRMGCLTFRYPADWTVLLNRKDLEPLVQAWSPLVMGLIASVSALAILLYINALALLFFAITLIVARYSDRILTVTQSWKLSSAACVPGLVLGLAGFLAYTFERITFGTFVVTAVLHLMVIWCYLVLSPLALPRQAAADRVENPFAPLPPQPTTIPPESPTHPRNLNPFAAPDLANTPSVAPAKPKPADAPRRLDGPP